MGYYEEQPPRHGHRTPSELAEDEILSALRGDFCGMPARAEQIAPTHDDQTKRKASHDNPDRRSTSRRTEHITR